MRYIKFLPIIYFFSLVSVAQTPESFKYQSIVRNSNGEVIGNQSIGFKISILSGALSLQNIVYSESHLVNTNSYGLANLDIGKGIVISDTFSNIGWGLDSHFVKIEIDITGGTNYQLMGVSQLQSVPYALYAKESGQSQNKAVYLNTHVELQDLDLDIGTFVITNGYHSPGDGGGAEYIIKSISPPDYNAGSPDNNAVVQTQNGIAVISNWKNVKAFGVKGDGSSDDTPGIQACIDYSGDFATIIFPKPTSYYNVTQSLIIQNGQTLTGSSKKGCLIKSNMPDPLIVMDKGIHITNDVTFNTLALENLGGTAIYSRDASNWAIYSCTIIARSGGFGIDSELSKRIGIYSSFIGSSGGFAVKLFNNSNVFQFYSCRMGGGQAGGVAKIGESYNVSFENCVFETTLYGIDIASEGGICTNFSLKGCSFEECSEPLKLGLNFAVIGADISNNFFSNKGNSGFTKDICIQIGRLRAATIVSNTFTLASNEDAYSFTYFPDAVDYMKNSEINNNEYRSFNNIYRFVGFNESNKFYLSNNNVLNLEKIFAQTKYFTTQTINDSDGLSQFVIEPMSDFGGRVEKVEIIGASGSLDGSLRLGRGGSISDHLNQSLSSISFTQGYADISNLILAPWIRANDSFTIRYAPGTTTNSFRVRVTYKY